LTLLHTRIPYIINLLFFIKNVKNVNLLDPKDGGDISSFLTQQEAHQILVAMVDNLTPEVYLLGDSVIAQGEMGREMFFLVKGLVDVVKFSDLVDASGTSPRSKSPNGNSFGSTARESAKTEIPLADTNELRQNSTKLVTLGSGAYFGELALLRDPSKGSFARR
tara:strand:- start:5 stop:496 length:492 start_codon:yes stop_codon:yes gene_type:complete